MGLFYKPCNGSVPLPHTVTHVTYVNTVLWWIFPVHWSLIVSLHILRPRSFWSCLCFLLTMAVTEHMNKYSVCNLVASQMAAWLYVEFNYGELGTASNSMDPKLNKQAKHCALQYNAFVLDKHTSYHMIFLAQSLCRVLRNSPSSPQQQVALWGS